MNRGGTYQSVQALRGVAALLVTVFHAGLRSDPSAGTFRVGNAGVDIFFVISGFVMWTVTVRRPTTPAAFLQQRFIRLVPMYWLLTLAMVAGWAAMPSAFPRMHPTLVHVLLSMAFLPHMSPDTGVVEPVLGQGWTLNFEVFFYLLFAMVLILPLRTRLRAIAAALLALPLLGTVITTGAVPAATLLSPLLVEFLGGVCLAHLAVSGWQPAGRWGWGAVAAGAALLLMAAPAADDDFARLLQYGVPAFLIVGGAIALEAVGHLRVPRPLCLLGDASYSLYLSHTFVISILGKLWPAAAAPWAFMATVTVLAALTGLAVYALLENPLLALMRGRRPPSVAALLARP